LKGRKEEQQKGAKLREKITEMRTEQFLFEVVQGNEMDKSTHTHIYGGDQTTRCRRVKRVVKFNN
jgi:hypothetical protein